MTSLSKNLEASLHRAVQSEVQRRSLWQRIWPARTSCLGLCPRDGAAVALTTGAELLTSVTPADAPALLDLALGLRS